MLVIQISADIGNSTGKLRNNNLPGDVDTDFLTVAAATPSALSSGLSSGLSSSSLSLESLSSDDQTQSPASVRCNRPDWPEDKAIFFKQIRRKIKPAVVAEQSIRVCKFKTRV